MGEQYAYIFAKTYNFPSIGLRYFNVFGPRQDPSGAYAAVIPRWIDSLLQGRSIHIFGDGETSRDFTFVTNVVEANLLAATAENPAALNQVFNIAFGRRTTLNQLFEMIQNELRLIDPSLPEQKPVYEHVRPGDVRHSHAAIAKAQQLLGYAPTHDVEQGLRMAMEWYHQKLKPLSTRSAQEFAGAV
jgi:UDP-N-acetylglucosamine 4-epimerase